MRHRHVTAVVFGCALTILMNGTTAVHKSAAQSIAFVEIDVLGTAMSGAIMDAAREGANTSARPNTVEKKVAAVDVERFNYTSSAARTRSNVAMFAAKSRRVDPQRADELERMFATQDVMSLVDTEMRKVGLSRTNLADAYAVWWTNAWLATRGRTDNLPVAQMQAVRLQAATALLETPQAAALTNDGKQQFAEALLIQAMLISASVEMAAANPTLLAATKSAVAKGAIATGIDLSKMELTANGFTIAARQR